MQLLESQTMFNSTSGNIFGRWSTGLLPCEDPKALPGVNDISLANFNSPFVKHPLIIGSMLSEITQRVPLTAQYNYLPC